jgi:hypothetical protein
MNDAILVGDAAPRRNETSNMRYVNLVTVTTLEEAMRRLFCCLLFTAAALSAYPQTAERIERLLMTGAVSYADAAQFVLEAADVLAAPTTTAAFTYAVGQGWLPRGAEAGGTARLDGLSLLIMQSFNIQGGLLYGFTKNAHYAYRELVYLNVIQGRNDPAMEVSGDLLLFMVNRLLSYQEVGQI